MDFVALNIPVADGAQAEILVAELAEFPFESFESGSDVLKAGLLWWFSPSLIGHIARYAPSSTRKNSS